MLSHVKGFCVLCICLSKNFLGMSSYPRPPPPSLSVSCVHQWMCIIANDLNVDDNFSDTDNQRVIVKVKDVNDEPPYFINRPLPMQAVVKLNAPPNTRVFTLQAKDPDTDHNLHYFLVRDRSKIFFGWNQIIKCLNRKQMWLRTVISTYFQCYLQLNYLILLK